MSAIVEGHGNAALELLNAGAETDKIDTDGHLAIDLAPDMKVKDRQQFQLTIAVLKG